MDEQHGQSYLKNQFFEDYSHPYGAFTEMNTASENYEYLNASTCPDCGGGMVKLGGCFTCQSCGHSSCSF
ncbi:MAG: hypothetical protein DWP97_12875 [Calditrichaeota bacterium]|nr:MAG: hypothetical protein DWP97_12875 [Calditrichota bacterium]